MTSAAPARKPYRKAPPQHCESRHTVPVFREDGSGSALPSVNPASSAQPDPFQVNSPRKHSPIFQRTRFADPYSRCLEKPSWPQVSDSELDVSSLSSLELSVLPPPRIFSHGSLDMRLPTKHQKQQEKNRFISHSENLLVLSDEDDIPSSEGSQQCIRGGSSSYSSRIVERSLAFKEKAEILVPRDQQQLPHAVSFMYAHPPKGILKQTHQLGVQSYDSLRKSKSAEMLGQVKSDAWRSRGRSRKPKSMSLDRERGIDNSPMGRAASTSSTSPSSVPPDWKIQLLEEKIKFSQFLDEITYRVLSPASLKMLGGKLPEPVLSSKGNQTKHHNNPQTPEKQERCRPWDEWSAHHSRAAWKSREGRPNTWHILAESPKRVSHKQHVDAHQEGARPKAEGPIYSKVRGGEYSEWDDRFPRGIQHQPQPHQLSHLESRALQKDNMDKSGLQKVDIPTICVEGEKTPLSNATAFTILSQIKESLSDADRINTSFLGTLALMACSLRAM